MDNFVNGFLSLVECDIITKAISGQEYMYTFSTPHIFERISLVFVKSGVVTTVHIQYSVIGSSHEGMLKLTLSCG